MVLAEWPDHFPACCPPADADDLSGDVLVLVAADPPGRGDFASAAERGVFKDADPCLRAGMSCAREQGHLVDLRRNTRRLRNHKIACAALTGEHGKIKKTLGAGHYTMWLRRHALDAAPSLFRVSA